MSDFFNTTSMIGQPAQPDGLLDKLVSEQTIGGPLDPRDTRMILHRRDLEMLLEVAKTSLSGTVVLNRAGLKVKTWCTREGHHYQTMTLLSAPPKPGASPVDPKR